MEPEGAVLFSEDVQITTTLMREVEGVEGIELVPRDTVITGSSIGFRAAREGGSVRDGFLTADGAESITLKDAPVDRHRRRSREFASVALAAGFRIDVSRG